MSQSKHHTPTKARLRDSKFVERQASDAQGASLYLTYRYPVSANISQLDAFQTIGCFRRTAIAEVGGSLNV